MSWRWLLFDYVDPALRLTRRARRAIRARAWDFSIGLRAEKIQTDTVPKWTKIVLPLAPATAMMLATAPMLYLRPSISFVLFVVPLQVFISWVLMAWIGRWTWRPFVLEALREAGHEICPRCGYWLRGLGSDVKHCPECGVARLAMNAPVLEQTE